MKVIIRAYSTMVAPEESLNNCRIIFIAFLHFRTLVRARHEFKTVGNCY